MKKEKIHPKSTPDTLSMSNSQIDEVLTRLDKILKRLKHPETAGQEAVYEAEQAGLKSRFEQMELKPGVPSEDKSAAAHILADLYCATQASGENETEQRALREYFIDEYLSGTLLPTFKASIHRRIETRVKTAHQDSNLSEEERREIDASANLLRLSIDRKYPGGVSKFGEELVSLTDPLPNSSKPNEGK